MRKRRFLALAACGLALLIPGVVLGVVLGVLPPLSDRPAPLQQLSDLALPRGPEAHMGGFSALDIGPDGHSFAAVSDRGSLFLGQLQRDATGALTGWTVTWHDRFLNDNNRVPPGGSGPDVEGLAMGYRGGFAISMEKNRDMFFYSEPGAIAEMMPAPPDSADLPANRKYEALANDARDRLYTLPEHAPFLSRDTPLWRLDPGSDHWVQDRRLTRSRGFLSVGADFGPDGRFYLLERAVRFGFASRVRRFDLDNPEDTAGELVWQTTGMRRSNFEGLSVWRHGDTPTAPLVLSMISDDNFSRMFRSRILEVLLPEAGSRGQEDAR